MVPTEIVIAAQQVVHAYCYHYDREEYESIGELFTDDATMDTEPGVDLPGYPLPAKGRDKIVEALSMRGDYFDVVKRRHVATTTFISSYNDNALHAHSYMIVIHTAMGGSPEIVQVGEYDDSMVSGPNGTWRIASRIVRKDRQGPQIDSMVR